MPKLIVDAVHSVSQELDFLQDLIHSLKSTAGVVAVVLGGSRSKGNHHANSDFDLGLYYDAGSLPDRGELGQIALRYEDRKEDGLLTAFGEWGPWINGGGWLTIQSRKVDLLYRDIGLVNRVFRQCLDGEVSIAYQPGHPHGFVNSIYFAEVAHCQILSDETNIISELKSKTSSYPEALKQGMIQKFLWEVEFSLENAKKGISYNDVSYVAGSCYRAISCLNQVLFAINKSYWMNEKGAVEEVSKLSIRPSDYKRRVNDAFSTLRSGHNELHDGIRIIFELLQEARELL